MAKIQRLNVILEVPDEDVAYYLNNGYNSISEDGEILQSGEPTDFATLKDAYVKLQDENKALREEIASLKANKTVKAKTTSQK